MATIFLTHDPDAQMHDADADLGPLEAWPRDVRRQAGERGAVEPRHGVTSRGNVIDISGM